MTILQCKLIDKQKSKDMKKGMYEIKTKFGETQMAAYVPGWGFTNLDGETLNYHKDPKFIRDLTKEEEDFFGITLDVEFKRKWTSEKLDEYRKSTSEDSSEYKEY